MAETVDAEHSKFELLDWGLLLGAAGIWGASFFFIDIGLEAFEPGLVTFFRITFGCIVLWLIPTNSTPIASEDKEKGCTSRCHMDCVPTLHVSDSATMDQFITYRNA